MRMNYLYSLIAGVIGLLLITADSKAGKIEFEHPDAKEIMLKDIPPGPRHYAIPSNCKLDNPDFIKKMAPKGKKLFNNKKAANCVACHCAPGSKGCGNIGPNLAHYKNTLMKAPYLGGQKKTVSWLFQRVADYRVQIPPEYKNEPYFNIMTVNLTTGKLSYDDVCAITAFLLTLE
ncbi:sulfur-oxidizing protein SoxX [Persephonella hydrogeniphila]|uniref:Sulfur-oxidizing protein SoxX n=1 Tax=Persephonella hydrogeniphila TaxID=198703 RepID=A0A285NBN2_9AQUI|nr:sulfur oxidation c-type cytochrome SoxX [Persephonella hydrogeniphila]SNZ06840.1 sulfur-oxidizing protein SoxX [Persephonella hydrogeniphila]